MLERASSSRGFEGALEKIVLFLSDCQSCRQGLQLRPVPARNRPGAELRSHLRGHRRKIANRPLPVPGPTLHPTGGRLLRYRQNVQGRSRERGPQRSGVPENHDEKMNDAPIVNNKADFS